MSTLIAKPPHEDHEGALANDFDTALENVTVGLEHAGETIHDYAEDVLQSLDHPEPGSTPSVRHALRMIRRQPLAVAAAIATALSALASLAFATRRTKAHLEA